MSCSTFVPRTLRGAPRWPWWLFCWPLRFCRRPPRVTRYPPSCIACGCARAATTTARTPATSTTGRTSSTCRPGAVWISGPPGRSRPSTQDRAAIKLHASGWQAIVCPQGAAELMPPDGVRLDWRTPGSCPPGRLVRSSVGRSRQGQWLDTSGSPPKVAGVLLRRVSLTPRILAACPCQRATPSSRQAAPTCVWSWWTAKASPATCRGPPNWRKPSCRWRRTPA